MQRVREAMPARILNFIGNEDVPAAGGECHSKINPHNGKEIGEQVRSRASDVACAVAAAKSSQKEWARTTGVRRGEILFSIASCMDASRERFAEVIAMETGKSKKEALGETLAAINLARFMAGEGQRLYGRTTTSGVNNKFAMTIREPVGVAGLIVAANTPIANVAWKVFPALICGNSAVLKASEDTPYTAWLFSRAALDAGLPPGVLNIVYGLGNECGAPIVESPEVDVVSFTGSTAVGKIIAEVTAKRLAKVSLELGGKNALLVCDDADLENAVHWSILSAFSNAGQRCAAASRIVIFERIYDEFRKKFLERVNSLKVGPNDTDDFGPVINARQLNNMLSALGVATKAGAKIVAGGARLTTEAHRSGFYLAPTVVENALEEMEISKNELFGPITCLYRARDFTDAIRIVNNSPYGLTAAIHTRNINRALEFTRSVEVGVVSINGGTHGSEPHMPFGGVKLSGNGTREPGTEAIDVYSNTKDVYQFLDPSSV